MGFENKSRHGGARGGGEVQFIYVVQGDMSRILETLIFIIYNHLKRPECSKTCTSMKDCKNGCFRIRFFSHKSPAIMNPQTLALSTLNPQLHP